MDSVEISVISSRCIEVISEPEENVEKMKEVLAFIERRDVEERVRGLAHLSTAKVFRTIVPLCKIRTLKDVVKDGKDTLRLKKYEKKLISAYTSYIRLMLEDECKESYVAACELLSHLDHFNCVDRVVEKILIGTTMRGEVGELCCKALEEKLLCNGLREVVLVILDKMLDCNYSPRILQCCRPDRLRTVAASSQGWRPVGAVKHSEESGMRVMNDRTMGVQEWGSRKLSKENGCSDENDFQSKRMKECKKEMHLNNRDDQEGKERKKNKRDLYNLNSHPLMGRASKSLSGANRGMLDKDERDERDVERYTEEEIYNEKLNTALQRLYFTVLKSERYECYGHVFDALVQCKEVIRPGFMEGLYFMLNNNLSKLDCSTKIRGVLCILALYGNGGYDFRALVNILYTLFYPLNFDIEEKDYLGLIEATKFLFVKLRQPVHRAHVLLNRIITHGCVRNVPQLRTLIKEISAFYDIDLAENEGGKQIEINHEMDDVDLIQAKPFFEHHIYKQMV